MQQNQDNAGLSSSAVQQIFDGMTDAERIRYFAVYKKVKRAQARLQSAEDRAHQLEAKADSVSFDELDQAWRRVDECKKDLEEAEKLNGDVAVDIMFAYINRTGGI